jgi:hypothetical protein
MLKSIYSFNPLSPLVQPDARMRERENVCCQVVVKALSAIRRHNLIESRERYTDKREKGQVLGNRGPFFIISFYE